jgi:hypothetical protein
MAMIKLALLGRRTGMLLSLLLNTTPTLPRAFPRVFVFIPRSAETLFTTALTISTTKTRDLLRQGHDHNQYPVQRRCLTPPSLTP